VSEGIGRGKGEARERETNVIFKKDEAAINKNNSVYTNTVASLSLIYATEFAKILGLTPDPIWMEIATNIKIPFDVQVFSSLPSSLFFLYNNFVYCRCNGIQSTTDMTVKR
jgi:hypothetical protein